MPEYAGLCGCCVDWRENWFFRQHGIDDPRGFYMCRTPGGFTPKPSPAHDVSTAGLMLVEMGRNPIFIKQSHRDCAAVRMLFESYAKQPNDWSATEREFRRSYSEALDIVKSAANALPSPQQLRVLEKICALQDINNIFAYEELSRKGGYQPVMHAYYSLTPIGLQPKDEMPEFIGLQIYDPEQGVFVGTGNPRDNTGIRIADLIDTKAFTPHSRDAFKITSPVDLAAAARNEVCYALAGETPRIGAFKEPGRETVAIRRQSS